MNVSVLEVVVVDLDGAGERVALGVDGPGGLPFAAPEVAEVRVDTADVDLQVAVLVKAEACSGRAILVLGCNVRVDRAFDTGSKEMCANS